MKKQEYLQHVRRALLAEQMERISKMTDKQVEEVLKNRLSNDEPKSSIEVSIREGVNYKEVDQMLGIELYDSIAEIDLSDNDDLTPEELDSQISLEFSDVTKMFSKKEGASCIITYAYFDPADDSDDEDGIRGHVMVFGDCRSLDTLIEQAKTVISENAVDGVVNLPNDDDDEDENDPLLDEINERLK